MVDDVEEKPAEDGQREWDGLGTVGVDAALELCLAWNFIVSSSSAVHEKGRGSSRGPGGDQRVGNAQSKSKSGSGLGRRRSESCGPGMGKCGGGLGERMGRGGICMGGKRAAGGAAIFRK